VKGRQVLGLRSTDRAADLRPPWRWRPTDLLLLVLVLAVLAVVVTSVQRPDPPLGLAVAEDSSPRGFPLSSSPPPATASPSSRPAGHAASRAALAATGGVVLRWTGTACPDFATATFGRSTDGGASWTTGATPLAVVDALSLAGANGLALGRDAACEPASATTADGGRTWHRTTLPTDTIAADLAADVVWSLGVRTVRRGPLTQPHGVGNGCATSAAGSPSLVSATSADTAWLLCQDAAGGGRLLIRTYDGTKTWRRLAGRRAETGLAGDGVVVAMDFVTGSLGWALIRGAGCAEGELRLTTTGGEGWTTLPCLAQSVAGVTEILAVTLLNARTALAVALTDGRTRLLRSSDGGRAWTLAD
jgi:hypothetical protein